MKKIRDFIKEAEEVKKEEAPKKYQLGCVMLYLDSTWKSQEVDSEDLYVDEQGNFGLEKEPHMTALFGIISSEVDDKTVIETATNNLNGKVPAIVVTEISVFENELYDVLKYDVEVTPEIQALHTALTALPYKTDYPQYHPHVTIAYLKKGLGKKYAKVLEEPISAYPKSLVYSKPNEDGTDLIVKTVPLYVSKKEADI
jgi:2'-5' RNA ligase